MKNNRVRRRGFTVIDLAVISAVTVITMSITVPALHQAQDEARLLHCQNNLKQIGLACHNYHDVHQSLPGAWYARYYEADSRPWVGWQVMLLPYLEQAVLWERIGKGQGYDFNSGSASRAPEWPSDDELLAITVPGFRCPTDTVGETNPIRGGFGTSNYSGNAGSKAFDRFGSGSVEAFWPGAVNASTYPVNQEDRFTLGLFAINGRVKFRDVTDGTSYTIMLTERSAVSGAGLWMGVRSSRHDNDVATEFSHTSRINKSFAGASSFHAVPGVNILMGDGSVRYIGEDIDSGPPQGNKMHLLQALAGRADNQIIGEF